jgi:hypothetical protein
LGYLQDLADRESKKKVSHPSTGVGAHFISSSESKGDDKEAKLMAKAKGFRQGKCRKEQARLHQGRTLEVIENCSASVTL